MNSSFSISSIQSWSIVLLGTIIIVPILWALWKIYLEYTESFPYGKLIHLGKLNFSVPPWWKTNDSDSDSDSDTKTEFKKENAWEFTRPETNYGFKASFLHFDSTENLVELANRSLLNELIVFDKSAEYTNDSHKIFLHNNIIEKISDSYRMEGLATFNEEKRIYLDWIFFRLNEEIKTTYSFRYQSSVLAGTVEGPFFERVLHSISLEKTL